jgi:hypothetical protein
MQITYEQTRYPGTHAEPPPGRPRRRGRAVWRRFMRHLLEMVAAMAAGMIVLGVARAVLGDPPGYDKVLAKYAYMAVAMAAPMVAWMRRMGHPWADCREMTAGMVVPMFALVVPVALGLEGYVPGLTAGSLMLLSHVAMIGGMAGVMLYRWDRYALGTHRHGAVAPASEAGHTTSVRQHLLRPGP